VLSGRGLCVGLITRPEESDKVRCVGVCKCEVLAHCGAAAPWGGGVQMDVAVNLHIIFRKSTATCFS
jgi:hypothetical protein